MNWLQMAKPMRRLTQVEISQHAAEMDKLRYADAISFPMAWQGTKYEKGFDPNEQKHIDASIKARELDKEKIRGKCPFDEVKAILNGREISVALDLWPVIEKRLSQETVKAMYRQTQSHSQIFFQYSIDCIKAIRELTGSGLKEAKDLYDYNFRVVFEWDKNKNKGLVVLTG